MLSVNGQSSKSRAEYDNALSDQKIIDAVKKKYDLSTKEGITGAYREIRTVHFKSSIGDAFDDEIFDLYEKVKSDSKEVGKNTSSKTSSNSTKSNTASKKEVPANKTLTKTSDASIDNVLSTKIDAAARKSLKKQNLLRLCMIFVFLLVGVGSIGYFVKYYSDARQVQADAEFYANLKDSKYAEILKNVEQVVKREYDEDVVIPPILDEYLALYNKNKNLIGWIQIADTIIDYPVMQSNDNDYYLKHNFSGDKDSNGSIFLDTNCDIILGNDNFILYGHHMKNGKMFSQILKYANKDFYEKHKYITFDTIYEKGKYEVMFAFRSRIYNSDEIAFKYYQFIDANSQAEFDSYMEEMEKLSLIQTGVSASYGDQLITLSTCDYQEDKNGRFVVVAKKIN